MSLIVVATGLVFQAAPTSLPLPRPEALKPLTARAVTCGTNPTFTGRLTASSASTTAVARITVPTVYGYISNVDGAWSCTASIRYSAVTWNTTTSSGTFDWGNLINSTTVACNWTVGSTDYLKANSTSDCADSDAEYAMAVTLSPEQVYQNNHAHTSVGDFSFAHSDCDTYHGSEPIKTGASFSTGSTANRPDTSNCDPITIDSVNYVQTITYDNTPPAVNFDTPDEAASLATVTSPAYTVQFDATDAVAGFGGANGWTLQRQIAAWDGTACGTFVSDPATGATTTGTTNALNQTVGQTLATGSCYHWTLGATDQNGKVATTTTSGPVLRDVSASLGTQRYRRTEGWDLGAGDSLAVDVVTGNVMASHPILTLPIRGSSVSGNLTYNSQDPANVGLGRGWRLDAQRRLTLNGDGTVTFIGPDGARSTFTSPSTIGTVTTYTRPSTLYATLVKDTSISANEFILTYRDGSKDKFDILGSEAILVRAEDRFANGVTVSYVTGTNRIDKITDTAASPNRTIDFAYDGSNRLASITDWAYVSGGVVQATATGSRRQTRFFYDASSNLAGWADPINTSGSCPTGGSHLTCLTYTGGLLTAIGKTQTVETLSAGALGNTTRAISTAIAYTGGDVATVTDAEEQSKGSPARTVFSRPAADQIKVVRPGSPASETTYGLVSGSDALGRIQSVWRKFGASLIEQRTAYDATYPIEPASVTENYGGLLSTPARTTSSTYVASSLGLVSRLTAPLTGSTNRTTDYTYNTNNDVTQQIVALDGSGTIRTVTRYCYDISCTTSGTGSTMSKRIDNYVDGTEGNGAADVEDVTTAYQYDAYGQGTRTTRSNYNAAGTLLDSAAGGSIYDDKGNLTASITNYADGTVTNPGDDITPNATTGARTDLTRAFTYDTAGNQISSADPRRAIETAKGTSLNADDFISRTELDALAESTKLTAARTPGDAAAPKFSTSTYDELGGTRETADYGGLVAGTEADRDGRPTQTFQDQDGAGGTAASISAQTTYDSTGRTLTAKDRLQVATSSLGYTLTSYDELGRTTDVTEASGSSPDIATITHTTYDALDRSVTQTVGSGGAAAQTTTTGYDLGGRVISTDDEFTCATTTYDYRDLALTETTGLAGGTCASGSETRTITHTVDGLGRRTRSEVTSSGSTDFGDRPLDVTLDAAGRQLTASTRKGGTTATTTFTLDPIDQVLAEARPDGSTAKTTYDPAGNATDRCYWQPGATVGACYPQGTTPWTNPPTQVTTTVYDARNNRIELRDSAASTTTTYDPANGYQISALYLPTGTGKEHQTLYSYDARHRVLTVTTQLCTISSGHACSSTTATGSDTYAYDDNDNRSQVLEANGATSSDRRYCYDGLNRLRARQTGSACTTTTGDETYTYDDPGNRLTAPASTYTYDSTTGQLTGCSPSCGTVSSDSAGNLKQFNGWAYEYDAQNRLVRACKAATCSTGSPDKVEFSYDGEGHRTQIKEYTAGTLTTTRDFRYQGDAIVEESTNGTVSRGYVVDDAGRILKVCDPSCTSPTTTYLVAWNGHGDALGLWRINGDGTLTLANSYTYSTWGTPTTAVAMGSDLKFRFLYVGSADVQWDDSSGLGLAYMHARHYSPAIGRFLQPDPARVDANGYSYTGGNPVTKTDPGGQCFGPVLVICVWGLGDVVVTAGVSFTAWATSQIGAHLQAHPVHVCLWGCSPAASRQVSANHCYSRCFWLHSQDKRLTPGQVGILDRLLRRHGGVHGLKKELGAGSGEDLFTKPNGDIVLKPRNGTGPGEPTGWNLRDLRGER